VNDEVTPTHPTQFIGSFGGILQGKLLDGLLLGLLRSYQQAYTSKCK